MAPGGRWSDAAGEEDKERWGEADEAGWGFGGEDNEGAEREMISAVRKRARVSGELPWMGGETGVRYDRRRPME